MPNGQWAGSNRAQRLPNDWAERRAEVFRLFGDICHECGLPGANEVDHLQAGDNHDVAANLRPIHGKGTPQNCHQRKSSAEGGRAAQARKPKRRRPPEPHPGLRT